MRAVVQRVKNATVTIAETEKVAGRIGKGFLLLLGVKDTDEKEDAQTLAEKIAKLRIMADVNDKMNLSLKDAEGEILVVSQFTLFADTSKGNRPSFIHAAQPDKARELYMLFIDELNNRGISVATGEFGSYMKISSELDGPVTIII